MIDYTYFDYTYDLKYIMYSEKCESEFDFIQKGIYLIFVNDKCYYIGCSEYNIYKIVYDYCKNILNIKNNVFNKVDLKTIDQKVRVDAGHKRRVIFKTLYELQQDIKIRLILLNSNIDLMARDMKKQYVEYYLPILQNKKNLDEYLETLPCDFKYDKEIILLEDIEDKICGIYGIYVNNVLVYIGKSKNIKNRWIQHIKEIVLLKSQEKYKLLNKYYNKKYIINFKLIEECKNNILDDKESYYINTYLPLLNTEIPSYNNSEKYKKDIVDYDYIKQYLNPLKIINL